MHKLAPNIARAKSLQCSTILSFGGPYSNHLHALAYACKEENFASIGLVRGELHKHLTPTLRDCQTWGMQLIPVSRNAYREYQDTLFGHAETRLASEISTAPFSTLTEKTLMIPEGGSNASAIDSVSKAYKRIFELPDCQHLTHALCATGTGATLAGLYKAAPDAVEVFGIQAVAEDGATIKRVKGWLKSGSANVVVRSGHLGGFGKIPPHLLTFIEDFETSYDVPLDPVYTGKAMFKLTQMIEKGNFSLTDKILFIHTGGLQGKRS